MGNLGLIAAYRWRNEVKWVREWSWRGKQEEWCDEMRIGLDWIGIVRTCFVSSKSTFPTLNGPITNSFNNCGNFGSKMGN